MMLPGQAGEAEVAAGLAEGGGEGTGVDFAGVEAGDGCGVDLARLGVDERGDKNAGVVKSRNRGTKRTRVAGDIETTFGRHFCATLRDERTHLRDGLEGAGDADHLARRGHFQVELGGDGLAQPQHVAVVHMTAVLAEMHRDNFSTREFGLMRGKDWIGLPEDALGGEAAVARLADGGDVIDVDAEEGHGER